MPQFIKNIMWKEGRMKNALGIEEKSPQQGEDLAQIARQLAVTHWT